MADRDGDGWPDIEPLPELPEPHAPPTPSAPPAPGPGFPPNPPPAILPPLVAPPPPWPPRPAPPPPPGPNLIPWAATALLALVVVLLLAVGVARSDSSSTEDQATATTSVEPERDDESEPVRDEVATTTTEATTTTAPPATEPPPPPPPGFGEGTWIVGQDIQPGLYMSAGGFACYWERRSAVGNGFDGLITNGGGGPAVVEVQASDNAFLTRGCDRWVDYAPSPVLAATFGDGDWVVGEQIEPGTYRVEAPYALCTWERARGFTHDLNEQIDWGLEVSAGDTVRLNAGERFTTSLCGNWVPA